MKIRNTKRGNEDIAPGKDQSATLLDVFENHVRCRAQKNAFIFLGDGTSETDRLNYSVLRQRGLDIAAILRERCPRETPVLLVYPPGLDFIPGLIGCLYAGNMATVAPSPNSSRGWDRVRAIARDARPAAVLTLSSLVDQKTRASLLTDLPATEWIATDLVGNATDTISYRPDPKQIALLQYTSGSTLSPRGVMISHYNLLHNQRMMAESFGHTSASVGVNWVPVFHDMGLTGAVLQTLYCGGTSVLMPPLKVLRHPILWLRAISRYRGNTSTAPSFAYELCVKHVPAEQRLGLDLSCWDAAICGGEPIRAEVLEAFAEALAGTGFSSRAFFPAYGLAEATLLVTTGGKGEGPRVRSVDPVALAQNRVEAAVETRAKRLVSCGSARLGQRVLIVDPKTRRALPADKVGEIWLAGGSIAQGYWQRPTETRTLFQASLADDDCRRYLRTGDLGFLDEDGLFTTGRLKEVIVIHGRNFYPQDIEEVVRLSHPALAGGTGAAFAVEVDGREAVVLVFEPARHAARMAPTDAVSEAAAGSVFQNFGIRLHDFVLLRPGSLPRTTSGKIRRGHCRKLYLEAALPLFCPRPAGGAFARDRERAAALPSLRS
jgi:acyl-CoA synthetase (AMP-forming)/AMP-acid ligase II